MNANRDPFGLANLPELRPPQDGWAAIASQLQSQQRRRRHWLSGLAVAASVALAVGIVSVLPQPDEMPVFPASEQNQVAGQPAPNESVAMAEATAAGASPVAAQLQSLQKLSQRLEQNLVVLRSGVGAMPAEMVVYQVELEDLVAQLDAAISQQPDSAELWQQRVSLLLDLNQIYGAGLRRDEPYVASL